MPIDADHSEKRALPGVFLQPRAQRASPRPRGPRSGNLQDLAEPCCIGFKSGLQCGRAASRGEAGELEQGYAVDSMGGVSWLIRERVS